MLWDENNTPHKEDLPLFKELGLEPFDLPVWKNHLVGEVETNDYKIKVWVECAPAQFWKFEIYNKGAEKVTYKLSTGSGNFREYWKVAEMFAQGLLTSEMINLVEI